MAAAAPKIAGSRAGLMAGAGVDRSWAGASARHKRRHFAATIGPVRTPLMPFFRSVHAPADRRVRRRGLVRDRARGRTSFLGWGGRAPSWPDPGDGTAGAPTRPLGWSRRAPT